MIYDLKLSQKCMFGLVYLFNNLSNPYGLFKAKFDLFVNILL